MFTITNPLSLLPNRRRSSSVVPLGMNELMSYFSYGSSMYPIYGNTSFGSNPQVEIQSTMASLGAEAYSANGPIFACVIVRLSHFAEARFQYRQLHKGRAGDLFGKQDLRVLEKPGPNQTTGDMLGRALLDVDLAGNWLATRRDDKIIRMRPDWVSVVVGSRQEGIAGRNSLDAETLGYIYHPGGRGSGEEPELLLAEEVAHFMPYPDPVEPYKGMSWITPVIREVMADNAARDHKLAFFERGATSNLAINIDPARVNEEEFKEFVEAFRSKHEGLSNAYKTMFLRGAADMTVIGNNFEQMDFKIVQGAGETRIAAAAGVPPVIVGLSEGLQAATYSNYDQARRRFADGTLRFLWRNIAGSLETLVPPPDDQTQLWYDDRDIAFLRIDAQEEASLLQSKATAIKTLVDGGFEPDSATAAIDTGDLSLLIHTGFPTVQVNASAGVNVNESVDQQPPSPAIGNGTQPKAVPAKTP